MRDLIYVFVEGEWDLEFHERILEPKLYQKYHQVISHKYIKQFKPDLLKYIRVVHKLNADYYVLADMDNESSIEEVKERVSK